MRYGLRTLLIATAVGPPLLAASSSFPTVALALVAYGMGLVTVYRVYFEE